MKCYNNCHNSNTSILVIQHSNNVGTNRNVRALAGVVSSLIQYFSAWGHVDSHVQHSGARGKGRDEYEHKRASILEYSCICITKRDAGLVNETRTKKHVLSC
jgi:hypothetical protein